MSEPVAELFAELGFDVDRNALASAEKGITHVEHAAERAVAAVDRMGVALSRAGGKQGFWSGIAASFREGWQNPAAAEPQKPSIRERFVTAFNEEVRVMDAEAAGAKRPVPPRDPVTPKGDPHAAGAAVTGLTGLLDKAQHAMHGFMGLFAAHQINHFAHELMDASSALELTSKRLGITTDELQQLQYAANASDISAGSLANGLKFLQVNSTKAAEGGKAQAKVFTDLGVAVKDAEGNSRPIGELLEDVATAFEKTEDPAKRTALAMQVFGRSGVELVPMLAEGGGAIRALREEAEALGGGLSETLIENAGAYEKALKQFNFAFLGVKNAIGNFLLPILTRLSQAFTVLASRFNEIQSKTKFLQTLLGVGLAAVLGRVVLWLNAVGTAGVIAWLKNIGPIILLSAAIAGVTLVLEDLYVGLTGGKSAIGKWVDEWQGLGTYSEFVKNIAAGIDSITTALTKLWNSPGAALLDMVKGVAAEKSPLARWMKKNGYAKEGEFSTAIDFSKADEERANRPVALGRGVGAEAQSNIDIPRALGRGLNADAVSSFGQAKGSILNAQSANSDSAAPVNVTVNAHTNASPKEIARHATKAIEAHQAKQNRNIRNALVPHAR